ncbi:MAG: SUMF1/EgtB/PvdO family nonheme iron enzyme [Rubrivivax sp.]|nr:SUMF1/EgtB/PvdO family nonheme iron enzyme [Rubrivivax sp.]
MPSAAGWWGSSPGGDAKGARAAPAVRELDDPIGMRRAGAELLSLALIDSRNHLLALLAQDEGAPALRLAAQAGWFQEYWIARHVQRARGDAGDADAPRLAGIEPRIDDWRAPEGELPAPDTLRAFLAATLEVTLDLLAALPPAAQDDAALYHYRSSLLHEDRLCEAMALRLNAGAPPPRADRAPLLLPAQRWLLGTPRATGGLVPHNERWAFEVAVPEFEIDALPVNWARVVEFADDGGYDRSELWTDAGWAWVQAQGRRAPGRVEQLHGGVLVMRGHGRDAALQRASGAQPALHVSRHEAEAWCRWAGRRLPTEPEWEIAAGRGARQGFVWGDVFEWVAGSARAWPGAGMPAPGALDAVPAAAGLGVLRGASFATRARWRHAKARRFAAPGRDDLYCGFRSCAP